MAKYNPNKIEKKWQKIWEKEKIYQVDLKKAKKPYYNLMMFPYPSAEGLHVGNVYAFTGADIHARFRRAQGFDVFEPMGFDAFGIHSENFAIKKRTHPKILIRKNTNNFRKQLKNLGCIFDWRHEIDTTKPDYYKWTQWLFLQLFKTGLAYRKKAPVDWCPSCKTVLADEQVISGRCERCDSEVIQKEMEQWFFRITKYAEKLLKNLDWIDWSERTKTTQRNWIGKSQGALIKFPLAGTKDFIEVFTTRIDTIFSGTFIILAPGNNFINNHKSKIQNWQEVENYTNLSKNRSEIDRMNEEREITGVELRGITAINPATQERMPVWTADFVLEQYGTGAVFANAHDERDFKMAKKYNLPLKTSIVPDDKSLAEKVKNLEACYGGEGILYNSSQFDGLTSAEARPAITSWLKEKGLAENKINYKLRDWLISRQRYWGPPIPMIYCERCDWQPVPENDLPVLLPYVKNYRPKGTGQSPLALVEKFVRTKCPKCGGKAKRETDVSDTFLDSSWYFFRYPSSDLKQKPFDKNITKEWLPVDIYIGGQEHAVLHLLYTRFITMVLKDLGYIDFEEPFKKFRAHGLLTKGGAKMSKSKGNVVNPDDYYKKYGADTLRMYLMFIGPFSEGGDWQDQGIIGVKRFLEKVWSIKSKIQIKNKKLEFLLHKTIKKTTDDLENLRYNTAISSLMILVNEMTKEKNISQKYFQFLLILLSPFAPYITEELWSQLKFKGSVHQQKWPKYDAKLIEEKKVLLIIQINGKMRDKIETEADITEEKAKELALKSEKIKKWISNVKEVEKFVFVPSKLINLVTLDKHK